MDVVVVFGALRNMYRNNCNTSKFFISIVTHGQLIYQLCVATNERRPNVLHCVVLRFVYHSIGYSKPLPDNTQTNKYYIYIPVAAVLRPPNNSSYGKVDKIGRQNVETWCCHEKIDLLLAALTQALPRTTSVPFNLYIEVFLFEMKKFNCEPTCN